MASVPMTSWIPVERRGQKSAPNLKNMTFDGPQKEYMGSLARLVQGVGILGKSFSFLFQSQKFAIYARVLACRISALLCRVKGRVSNHRFGGKIPHRRLLAPGPVSFQLQLTCLPAPACVALC